MSNFASQIYLSYLENILTRKTNEDYFGHVWNTCRFGCFYIYILFLNHFIAFSVDKLSLYAHLIVLLMWICVHDVHLCVYVCLRESSLRAAAIFSLYFLISEGDWYLDGFVYQTQRVMARAFNKLIF